MDQGVIDGIVNGVGTESKSIGGLLKQLQSGNIRSYATWVVLGAVALLIVMGVTAIGFAAGVGQ
jgi:NADH-quinone oxidoreductase subunit L